MILPQGGGRRGWGGGIGMDERGERGGQQEERRGRRGEKGWDRLKGEAR